MAFDPVTYAAAVSAAKRYHDEHSGGSAIMVGTVTNGSTFPTVRPSGEALIIGDFVKPASGSTFPFTVGGITFATTSDQAVYDGNGGWMYNANPFQSTADTPVKSVATESVSGTAATQQAVNIENVSRLNGKVDKLSTPDLRAYTHSGSTQGELRVNTNPLAGAIARYNSPEGTLRTNAPVTDNDCANKKYVDDLLEQHEFDFTTASTTWTCEHNLGKYPSAICFDGSGNTIIGSIEHVNKNTLRISFNAAQSGKAIVN